MTLYIHLIALLLIFTEYHLSQYYLATQSVYDKVHILDSVDEIQRVVFHLGFQCILATVTSYLLDVAGWIQYTLLAFTLPILACVLGMGSEELHIVNNFVSIFTVLIVGLYFLNCISAILNTFKEVATQAYVSLQVFGWIPVVMASWHAILLPVQLLVFWLVMYASQLYVYISSTHLPIWEDGTVIVLLASIGECCATPISLFALSVTISYASYSILTLTKIYLQGWAGYMADNDSLRGWTEGFTMLLIAVQTGLLDLKPLQRAFLLSILLFIVASSLIQSMYEMAEPILLSLSAAHNKSVNKHVRAIVLFTFLWMFPLFMTYSICYYFDLDFWLLVIMSSCLLTTVQVIGALVVYALFMYDAVRTTTWDALDDVIYYTRSIVRILEFVVAVFVVCYGMKESITGEWSWVNSSILLMHCYFNVWQRLQTGWKTFLLRREAVKRMESLPYATAEQLAEYNDICSICYQSLTTARITPCGHYFHGVCLKKWLYIKENCPMCHKKIDQNIIVSDSMPAASDANSSSDDTDVRRVETKDNSEMVQGDGHLTNGVRSSDLDDHVESSDDFDDNDTFN